MVEGELPRSPLYQCTYHWYTSQSAGEVVMEVDIEPHLPIMVSTARLQLELGMHKHINALRHGVTVKNDIPKPN